MRPIKFSDMFSLGPSVPHNMQPGVNKTAEQMMLEWSAILKEMERNKPKGPRIDDDTIVLAGLDLFALEGEQIEKLNQRLNNEVSWNEFSDDSLLVFNPRDYKIKFEVPDIYKSEPKKPWDNVPQNLLPKRLRRQPMKLDSMRWCNYGVITYPTYDHLAR